MQGILIIAGIIFLLGGLLLEVPAVKNRITRPLALQEWDREETRVRQARQDVERAREDVATLLEELDMASDKVVNLMTSYAGQAREALSQASPISEPVSNPQDESINSKTLPVPVAAGRKPSATTGGNKKSRVGSGTKVKKPADDKYQTVYDLADQGMSVDDIAQLAKVGKGEVQLLLELKNRGGNR